MSLSHYLFSGWLYLSLSLFSYLSSGIIPLSVYVHVCIMDDSCHVALLVLLVDHWLADSIWTVTADPSPRFITAIRSTVLSALGWLILVWLCVLRVCVIWGHMSALSLCPVGEIIIIIGSYWHPADMHTLQFKPGLHCINSGCQTRNFTTYSIQMWCVLKWGVETIDWHALNIAILCFPVWDFVPRFLILVLLFIFEDNWKI